MQNLSLCEKYFISLKTLEILRNYRMPSKRILEMVCDWTKLFCHSGRTMIVRLVRNGDRRRLCQGWNNYMNIILTLYNSPQRTAVYFMPFLPFPYHFLCSHNRISDPDVRLRLANSGVCGSLASF